MGKILDALRRGGSEEARSMLAALGGSQALNKAVPDVAQSEESEGTARDAADRESDVSPIRLTQPASPSAPVVRLSQPPFAEASTDEKSRASELGPSMRGVVRVVECDPPENSQVLPFDSPGVESPSEQYRHVRTKILQHPSRPRIVLVSSPAASDGKTVTAINIAAAFGLNQELAVLLVDMDLRRRSVAKSLGVAEAPGLQEILLGECKPREAMLGIRGYPGLSVIPAGKVQANPTELMSSAGWRSLCKEFRTLADYVVFDGPPIEAVAEYGLIQEACDGIVLVTRTDHTPRPLLARAMQSVPKEKILGAVVNGHRRTFWDRTEHYYHDYSLPLE